MIIIISYIPFNSESTVSRREADSYPTSSGDPPDNPVSFVMGMRSRHNQLDFFFEVNRGVQCMEVRKSVFVIV